MEAIASPYRQLGGSKWTNEAESEPEICPPPPPRIQSRMPSFHGPKPSNLNHSTIPTEAEAWPLPPQPPQEDRVKRQIEPWPLPPVVMPQSTQCKNEDITSIASPHQIESPYVSQSPGRETPEDQVETATFTTELNDDDKRRTLTSMIEPLSVSPSTSSITISQSDSNEESPSTTTYDEDMFDPDLRNFVHRMRRSNDVEPPMPPPRLQSRAMSEMGLWRPHYRHEFDDENSTVSDWTTSTLPCKGKKSPEARPWLAPPLHRDILANEFDLSQIPSRTVIERPWLAPPHQDRLTPEGAAYLPHLPPHQGCRTPVPLSRSASIHDEGPVLEEYLIPESACQCSDRMRYETRHPKQNQKSYIRCLSSPPPLPPHKTGAMSPMRQLSLPVGPPLPPHQEHMTPSEGSLTLPRRSRSKHRYQDCVQLRDRDAKDSAFSVSAKNIFRRCKSGILAHTRRSTEIVDPARHHNRRSAQPVISRSDKTSLKTQSSDNSSFHDQVKELVSSVDLGECFIM